MNFFYNEPSYDFGKQKYKCHLCSAYYKRIDSLVFKKHLRVKHGILNDADYIPLVGKNFFDFSFDNEDDFTTETEWLSNLKKEINGKFNFLLININSILGESKYFSIQTLLQDGFLDMLVVMETKIGVDTPNERFDFNYNILRRDRQHGSGGLIIFIKKHYKISSVKIHDDFEVLSFVLGINHRLGNFIAGYNPHFEYSLAFNSYIERVLIESNLNHPTFLVGDLNQDLCCSKGDRLRILLSNFGLNMNYCQPTHYQGKNSSCIDISACNDTEIIQSVLVHPCPFSNHQFVHTICNFDKVLSNSNDLKVRVLNEKNLSEIKSLMSTSSFNFLDVFDDINDKWAYFKQMVMNIMNDIAPLKNFRKNGSIRNVYA